MILRYKKNQVVIGYSDRFNIHGLGEVIIGFDGGDMDSVPISDYDVQLPDGTWKDMSQAFKDHDIVPDNLNQYFSVPINDTCKSRGYNP